MPYAEFLLRRRAAAIRKREQIAMLNIAMNGTGNTDVQLSLSGLDAVADGR